MGTRLHIHREGCTHQLWTEVWTRSYLVLAVHLRDALRQPARAQGILVEVARLRRGHQMQFWSLVWSTSNSDDRDLLFEWLRTYMLKHVPQTVEISDLAFRFFHGHTNPRPLPDTPVP